MPTKKDSRDDRPAPTMPEAVTSTAAWAVQRLDAELRAAIDGVLADRATDLALTVRGYWLLEAIGHVAPEPVGAVLGRAAGPAPELEVAVANDSETEHLPAQRHVAAHRRALHVLDDVGQPGRVEHPAGLGHELRPVVAVDRGERRIALARR